MEKKGERGYLVIVIKEEREVEEGGEREEGEEEESDMLEKISSTWRGE